MLGVSSCLHVWGLRGLLAYRLCTPIVFYTLLFYTSIKASLLGAESPHHEPPCCSAISTITTSLPVFLPDNSIDTPAKKNYNCASGKSYGFKQQHSVLHRHISEIQAKKSVDIKWQRQSGFLSFFKQINPVQFPMHLCEHDKDRQVNYCIWQAITSDMLASWLYVSTSHKSSSGFLLFSVFSISVLCSFLPRPGIC